MPNSVTKPAPGSSLVIGAVLAVLVLMTAPSGWRPATAGELLAGRPAAVLEDGRLMLIASGGDRLPLRLAGLEAPLSAQARRQLRMLVAGKPVQVVVFRQDGRRGIVGRLLLGGADTGLRLLTAGLARYRPGEVERELEGRYRQAEGQARKQGLGIWSTRR